jgi:phosphatidate phosphatase APP1
VHIIRCFPEYCYSFTNRRQQRSSRYTARGYSGSFVPRRLRQALHDSAVAAAVKGGNSRSAMHNARLEQQQQQQQQQQRQSMSDQDVANARCTVTVIRSIEVRAATNHTTLHADRKAFKCVSRKC